MAVQPLSPKQLQMRWQDWLNVSLGVWLIIAPILGIGQMNDTAAWNAYLTGTVVVVVAAAGIVRVRLWEEWTNLLVGLWLVIAPFSLHFTDQQGAMWNQIIVGVLVSIASGSALLNLRSAYRNA